MEEKTEEKDGGKIERRLWNEQDKTTLRSKVKPSQSAVGCSQSAPWDKPDWTEGGARGHTARTHNVSGGQESCPLHLPSSRAHRVLRVPVSAVHVAAEPPHRASHDDMCLARREEDGVCGVRVCVCVLEVPYVCLCVPACRWLLFPLSPVVPLVNLAAAAGCCWLVWPLPSAVSAGGGWRGLDGAAPRAGTERRRTTPPTNQPTTTATRATTQWRTQRRGPAADAKKNVETCVHKMGWRDTPQLNAAAVRGEETE
jgi:hypothetical protein